jgi:hypothetical protein
MKHDIQECFHVSATEADSWKRALATPAETAMMEKALRPEQKQRRIPLFSRLLGLGD